MLMTSLDAFQQKQDKARMQIFCHDKAQLHVPDSDLTQLLNSDAVLLQHRYKSSEKIHER
jgi:hypothetical protein